MIEYLGKIETEFENTSACLSGAQMGSNHEKNWRSKISWHTPFNCLASGIQRPRLDKILLYPGCEAQHLYPNVNMIFISKDDTSKMYLKNACASSKFLKYNTEYAVHNYCRPQLLQNKLSWPNFHARLSLYILYYLSACVVLYCNSLPIHIVLFSRTCLPSASFMPDGSMMKPVFPWDW